MQFSGEVLNTYGLHFIEKLQKKTPNKPSRLVLLGAV